MAAALPTRSRTWSRAMRPGAVATRGNRASGHRGRPGGAGLAVTVSGTAWAEVTTAHGTDRLVAGQPATVLRCVVGVPVHAVRGGLGTGRGVGTARTASRALSVAPPGRAACRTTVAFRPCRSRRRRRAWRRPRPRRRERPRGSGRGRPGPAADAAAPGPDGGRIRTGPERPYPVEPPATQSETGEPETAELRDGGAWDGGAWDGRARDGGARDSGTRDGGARDDRTRDGGARRRGAFPTPQADPARLATAKAELPDFRAAPLARHPAPPACPRCNQPGRGAAAPGRRCA